MNEYDDIAEMIKNSICESHEFPSPLDGTSNFSSITPHICFIDDK